MASFTKKISFNKEKGVDFTTALRRRVNEYFEEKKISPRANVSMKLKSFFYVGLTAFLYTLLITNVFGSIGNFFLYGFLGLSIAIGTMNIAHDALHGSYAKGSLSNRVIGLIMDVCGPSSFYWKQEHTIDHHTFTNIAEHDSDLKGPIQLRLCPNTPYHSYHRFQHLYAPFLYMLNLIHWMYSSDIKRIYNIIRNRHEPSRKPSKTEAASIFFFKSLHAFLFIALPIMILPMAWWQVCLGYGIYLCLAGLTVTVIFQLAHIVENVAFPLPSEEGKIEESFLQHQLMTTSNFAPNSKLVKFLFGGLNFQVEHHLFPHICHIHLSEIAPIVKATAEEYGLPYYENATFFGAIRSHFRTLKRFGHPSNACSQEKVRA